jgi:hypothetical protein
MSLRSVLNLAYAVLTDDMSTEDRTVVDRRLQEPFDWELTAAERKKAEARRMLENKGQVGNPEDVMRYMTRG